MPEIQEDPAWVRAAWADDMKRADEEIEQLRAALESCEAWIDRWTQHVGACEGGEKCTCGRTAVLYETGVALGRIGNEQTTQGGNNGQN